MNKLSRRAFLTKTGALALGFSLPLFASKAEEKKDNLGIENQKENVAHNSLDDKYYNAYIEITQNNKIIFHVPDIELGQGIYTVAAMLLAEELDVQFSTVTVKAALPSQQYILKGEVTDITWGSGSTQKDWLPLQNAAATLRMVLIQAAAQLWDVAPDECRANMGQIFGPNNQQIQYAQLIQVAYMLPVPKEVMLKSKDAYRLIGKSQQRVDTPTKINGTALYAADINFKEADTQAKIGLIITCPVVGGKLVRFDDQQVLQLKGVHKVLRLENAICIVADHFWAASKAVNSLGIEWDFGFNANINTKDIYQQLSDISGHKAIVGYTNSSEKIETALNKTSHLHTMTYKQPMLAHAALEPLTCTISMNENHCEIWSCSQIPLWTQQRVASLLKRPVDQIIFHTVFVGGSFGRRLDDEYILQAVQFVQQISHPLKCIWSREEDFSQDHVRPPYLDQIEAGVDADGVMIAVKHHIIGPSVTARWDKKQLMPNGMDPDLLLGLESSPYQIPHYQLNYTPCEIASIIPGWWQGNGATRNIFILESLVNNCAIKAKKDPIEYRKLLKVNARSIAVMDMVSQHAQWDQPMPKGMGRGFALAHVFGSYIAMVVEAEVTAMSIVRLHRVIVTVDCGLAVNPDQIAAQIESGAIIGLGSALYNEVEIQNGQIQQRNFNQYRVLRMNESPQIEVHIVESSESPSGVGELGTIVAAPALAHALGSILNKQLYTLPLNRYLT